uniref:Uncharacterized protein n=1 Tax=Nelumbo nucifera TaxID=4432 RepID=A0A822XCF3_NELNU|nr:TPA_asm: hypothetical protein HUJ06_019483 [Nelumbo nucifera]
MLLMPLLDFSFPLCFFFYIYISMLIYDNSLQIT